MNGLILKIIALITMSIDHVGLVILNDNPVFRFIGRIAFPLYGFLLVEGFNHTKSSNKRLIKYYVGIIIVGLISEVIHDIVFFNNAYYLPRQNIFFTLLFALLCMTIYDKYSSKWYEKIISLMIVILIASIGELLMLDYGFLGILLIFGFYLTSKLDIKKTYINFIYVLLVIIYVSLRLYFYGFMITTYGVLLSIIPIVLYNSERGYNSKIIKYCFYLYYPIHLLLLLLIKTL